MIDKKRLTYPVLPLRDIVVFPHMIVPLFVGRKKSISALEAVMQENKEILLCAQIDSSEDEPTTETIYPIGVVATVLQLLKLPDGKVKVLVEGKSRVQIDEYLDNPDYFEAEARPLEQTHGDAGPLRALCRSVGTEFIRYAKINKNIPSEALKAITEDQEPDVLADIIAGHITVQVEQKQELLQELDIGKRLESLYEVMQEELSVIRMEKKIKSRVKNQMERTQREYYLNEQMKAIQKELGEAEGGSGNELSELETQINTVKMSKEAKEKANSELKKLRNMSPMSAEATVVRNYLDWLVSIPWGKKTRIKKDLGQAQVILDEDHFGLEKVKERIVEHLAVQQRATSSAGPILCLVGPPGVGKTSLGKSVARVTGREFIRISLGGVRDEAEIRGHRRTYIGSMPGKIIQSMKKAKTSNPLILLDEIDKMGLDMRGDPSSALLEVLDPEQNSTFMDHYLEVEYDLSNVMFLTTSNSYNIPAPLLDRMEVIPLSGYTEDEKTAIASGYLVEKQIKRNGLAAREFELGNNVLRDVIRFYTREAGVRNLERELAKLCRKAVTEIVKGQKKIIQITTDNLKDYLGTRRFKFGLAEEKDHIGVVTGLAYTTFGGELLSIEALKLPGKGRIKTTGKLGDVMKESIEAASSYVRSISLDIGVKPTMFEKLDIHVHVPEGATPKDGPSAGIGMVCSIVSVMTGIAVHKDIAMTGEVTLRGRVLPIGGLKEKLLAALRGGIKTVLIPRDNEKDLVDLPESVLNGLDIICVDTVAEVLERALVSRPVAIEWDEAAEEKLAAARLAGAGGAAVAH